MVALALSLSNVRLMSVGNRRQGTATLTMVASSSTYNNSGHDLPEGWAGLLGAPSKVDSAVLDGPFVASTIDLTFAGKIDVSGGKLILFGTPSALLTPRLTYTATTISAVAAGQHILDSANGFPAFVAGEPIIVTGFTGTAANNNVHRVVSRAASDIVVQPGGANLVDDGVGESVTISSVWQTVGDKNFEELPNGASITNGTYTATLVVQGY